MSDLEQTAERVATQLEKLTTQVEKLRTRSRQWIAAGIVAVILMGVAIFVSGADSRQQNREADRRWCALLGELTIPLPADNVKSPARARSERLVQQLTELKRELGCE